MVNIRRIDKIDPRRQSIGGLKSLTTNKIPPCSSAIMFFPCLPRILSGRLLLERNGVVMKRPTSAIPMRQYGKGILLAILIAAILGACSGTQEVAQSTATQLPPTSVPAATVVPTEPPVPPTEPPPTPTAEQEPTSPPPPEATLPPVVEVEGNGVALALPAPKEGDPSVLASANVNVRSGPGTEYASYGVLLEGGIAEVTGVSPDGLWWVVNYPEATLGLGWVTAEFTVASNTGDVPVVQPPPIPPTLVFTSAPAANVPQARLVDSIYLRSGPGNEFPAYGIIPAYKIVPIIYRNRAGDWWAVQVNSNLVPSGHGWVPAAYVRAKNARYTPLTPLHPAPTYSELPPPAEGAPTGYPMTPLYLRSGPGLEYPVLSVISTQAVGEITGRSSNGEWWQMRAPTEIALDGLAWVPASFIYTVGTDAVPVVEPPPAPAPIDSIEPSAGDPQLITLEAVNFFAGPGNEWPLIGVLPADAQAVVRGASRDGDWYIIRIPLTVDPGGEAWVKAEFVEAKIVRSVPILEPPAK